MPRKARLDAPKTLHHIIVRGIERRQIVDDDQDRQNFFSHGHGGSGERVPKKDCKKDIDKGSLFQ